MSLFLTKSVNKCPERKRTEAPYRSTVTGQTFGPLPHSTGHNTLLLLWLLAVTHPLYNVMHVIA